MPRPLETRPRKTHSHPLMQRQMVDRSVLHVNSKTVSPRPLIQSVSVASMSMTDAVSISYADIWLYGSTAIAFCFPVTPMTFIVMRRSVVKTTPSLPALNDFSTRSSAGIIPLTRSTNSLPHSLSFMYFLLAKLMLICLRTPRCIINLSEMLRQIYAPGVAVA